MNEEDQNDTREKALLADFFSASEHEEPLPISPDLLLRFARNEVSQAEHEVIEAAAELDPLLHNEIAEMRDSIRAIASGDFAPLPAQSMRLARHPWIDRLRPHFSFPSLALGAGMAALVLLLLPIRPVNNRTDGSPRIVGPLPADTKSLLKAKERAEEYRKKLVAAEGEIARQRKEQKNLVAVNQHLKAEQKRLQGVMQRKPSSPNGSPRSDNTPVQLARIDRANLPGLSELATTSGETRGSTQTILPVLKPLSPVATRITADALRFFWESVPNAATYRIEIKSREGDFVDGAVLNGNGEHSPSTGWATARPLSAGIPYLWKVTALDREGKEIAQSDNIYFEMLSEAQARRLKENLPANPVERALAYAQNGLYAQAEEELAAYWKSHPQDKSVPRLEERLRKLRRPLLTPDSRL